MTEPDRHFSLRRHLIRGAAGSLVFRLINTGLSLVMAVVLARMLGVKNLGIYAFCLSIASLLTVPATLGGDTLLVREVAAYRAREDYGLLRGLLARFWMVALLAALALALGAVAVGTLSLAGGTALVAFTLAMLLVPLQAGMRIQGAILRGLRHVLLGQAAETFRPVLVIAAMAAIYWSAGRKLRPEEALGARIAASMLLVAAGFVLLRVLLPRRIRITPPEYHTSRWLKSVLPLVFLGGMQIINRESAIILLGVLDSAEAVGWYRVADSAALLVPFGLLSVNMAIAPTVSELFAKGRMLTLQRLINKGVLGALLFAVSLAAMLLVFGPMMIEMFFGAEFLPAYGALVVLCLGQLVNVAMGPVGLILNMAGLERLTAAGVTIAALVTVILNLVLIPVCGLLGAAVASASGQLVWNVLLVVWLYKKTGIVSTFHPRAKPSDA